MWFAQMPSVPDVEALATKGTPYVLAAALVVVCFALVWVFKTLRSDLKEKDADLKAKDKASDDESDRIAKLHAAAEDRWRADMKDITAQFTAALKEQRDEFHLALKEMVADLRGGMTELKAGLTAVGTRMDRLEDVIQDTQRVYPTG